MDFYNLELSNTNESNVSKPSQLRSGPLLMHQHRQQEEDEEKNFGKSFPYVAVSLCPH
ncbi:hypothetical protein SAY87_025936 [Trapa incisa]|uniref:Uncharacterized protein n=2 Tax=Trapa TaxID=22665 RepID=A0AAN7LUV6_TRANT|nr:hypothetical protein SAY87_025936 [Trapa incisa]KAK4786487.1 hypothetical protein SAY86_003176 [Trapa natans]